MVLFLMFVKHIFGRPQFWIRKSIDEWIGVGNFMNCSDEVLGLKWNGHHAHVHSMGKTGIFTYIYRKTLAIHVPIVPIGSMYGIFTYMKTIKISQM